MVVGMPQSWESDARRGSSTTSLTVLLAWLTTPGNYARWQHAGQKKHARPFSWRDAGLPDGGRRETRAAVCQEIVALLHAEGLTHREERDVRSKLHDVEKAFWDAVAWQKSHEEQQQQQDAQRAIDKAREEARMQTRRPRRATSATSGTSAGGKASGKASGKVSGKAPRVVDVRVELLKRCRHYDTLAPALLEFGGPTPTPSKAKPMSVSAIAALASAIGALPADTATTAAAATPTARGRLMPPTAGERKPWGADAVDGGSGKSSMDVLLDWLSVPALYAQWRGDGTKHPPPKQAIGVKKKRVVGIKARLLHEIVAEMKRHGLVHRTTRDVRTKINDLERSVRAAVAWRATHGAELLVEHGSGGKRLSATAVERFRSGLSSVCKHYEKIGPAMVPLLCGEAAAADMDAFMAAVARTSEPPVNEETAEPEELEELGEEHESAEFSQDDKPEDADQIVEEDEEEEREEDEEEEEEDVASLEPQITRKEHETSQELEEEKRHDDGDDRDEAELDEEEADVDVDETSRGREGQHHDLPYEQDDEQDAPNVSERSPTHSNSPSEQLENVPQAADSVHDATELPAPPMSAADSPLSPAVSDVDDGPNRQSFMPFVPPTPAVPAVPAISAVRPTSALGKRPAAYGHRGHDDVLPWKRPTPLDPAVTSASVDELQQQLELDRLRHEQRCHALQEEQLELDLARQQIQITKEKALARHELRLAGVPEYDIDRAFPLAYRTDRSRGD